MKSVADFIKGKGVEYAVLMPTWFMQNFSEAVHLPNIRDGDCIVTATGEGKIPFVDCRDIAEVAFRALTDDKSHGEDYLLVGAKCYSYAEVCCLDSRIREGES